MRSTSPLVRPFWQAVTGYVDEPGPPDLPDGALLDPLRRGPAIWFQQMDAPRPQRNRIHLDVDVPPELAAPRIDAALAAGGTLLDRRRRPRVLGAGRSRRQRGVHLHVAGARLDRVVAL